jgi:hypothetical protein
VIRLARDLIAPIVLFYVLRAAGVSIYLAVIIGGLPAAASAITAAIRRRTLDRLALTVLAMLSLSALVSLVSGSPRFLLAKDGWMTAIWSLLFLASLRARRPLTFVFSQPLLEGRPSWNPYAGRWTRSAATWDELWDRTPQFRRIWRFATVVWAIGLMIDATARVAIAYTAPLDAVPALCGVLWPVTFLLLQIVTNVYFARAGFWQILHGGSGHERASAAWAAASPGTP